MKKLHISTKASMVIAALLVGTNSWAADLTAESSKPSVFYVGTNTQGIQWSTTSAPDASLGRWMLQDWVQDNDTIVIFTGDNDQSLRVNPNGDMMLANNAIYINRSEKKVGIGTNTPEDTLHIKGASGNIILEGDGYSKWRLGTAAAGGFMLQDDRSDTRPFMIDGNAPTKTLYVSANGNVGIGTPEYTGPIVPPLRAKLDVNGDVFSNGGYSSTWSDSNTEGDGLTNLMVLSANNSEEALGSDAGFALKNARTNKQWNFRTAAGGDTFSATIQGTSGTEFKVTNTSGHFSGVELYLGNGAKCVNGVWTDKSSRASKENIKELSTKDALAAFHNLQPVTYNYKTDKKEQYVGFIAEDVPELVAIQSRDGLSSMDMVAVLTKVVQEQEKVMAETRIELKKAQEKIAKQDTKITKLETMQKRVAQLESILTNLALDTSKTQKEKVSFNLK